MVGIYAVPTQQRTFITRIYQFSEDCHVYGAENQAGLKLEITVDGGRVRLRSNFKSKNRCRKKGSFDRDWKEPCMISIRVLNDKGELLQEVPQLLDATMADWKTAFKLLEEYLKHYNLKEASEITFIADGSENIWRCLPALL